MNKRKKQFLSILVGAMCIGYSSYSSSTNVYGQDNLNDEKVSEVIGETNDTKENNEALEIDDNKEEEINNENSAIITTEDTQDLKEKIDTKEMAALDIRNGQASLEDYKLLDMYYITEDNYEGVSLFLEGKDVTDENIQEMARCLACDAEIYRLCSEDDPFRCFLQEYTDLTEDEQFTVSNIIAEKFNETGYSKDSEVIIGLYNEIQNIKNNLSVVSE